MQNLENFIIAHLVEILVAKGYDIDKEFIFRILKMKLVFTNLNCHNFQTSGQIWIIFASF